MVNGTVIRGIENNTLENGTANRQNSIEERMDNVMINTRRSLMQFAAGATLITTSASTLAQAQAYPSRPARIVVGFPAGGVADIKARLMGQWLSNRFGQPFIVDNRSGASGNIATEAVAKAAPMDIRFFKSRFHMW